MFDAAHAALIAAGEPATARTHQGMIATVGLKLVKTNRIVPDLGVSLNKVERLRMLADYTGDPISGDDAKWAVEEALIFVDAIRIAFALD